MQRVGRQPGPLRFFPLASGRVVGAMDNADTGTHGGNGRWLAATLLLAAVIVSLAALSHGVYTSTWLLAAAPLALLAIPYAGLSANLPVGIRHTYTGHYAVVAGTLSGLVLVVPAMGLIAFPLPWIQPVLVCTVAAAPAWIFAHLLATAAPVPLAYRVAAASALVCVAALTGLHPLARLLAGLAAVLLCSMPVRRPPNHRDNLLWSFPAFVQLNIVILFGVGAPVLVFVWLGGLLQAFLPAPPDPETFDSGAADAVILLARMAWALTSGLITLATCLYAAPRGAPRWHVVAAAAGLLAITGGMPLGLWPLLLAASAAGAAILGMEIGRQPRGGRWRWALLAATTSATLAMQTLSPVDMPVLNAVWWFVEAVVLGTLWISAYFLSIRWIRATLFPAPRLPAPPSPPKPSG